MPRTSLSKILSANVISSPYDEERFSLDWTRVKVGEIVHVRDTGHFYLIKDLEELDNANGYFQLDGGGGGGTVSSVGLSMPAGFSVGNSPVVNSGTINVTTTLSGMLKGNGSGFVVATPGTDYLTAATAPSSIVGTANEIAVNNPVGVVTISLPSSLTFTGKSVTGGLFVSGAFNGTVGATTASTAIFTGAQVLNNTTGLALNISGTISGATSSYGALMQGAIASGVTSQFHSFTSAPTTAVAAFTLSTLRHFVAQEAVLGAGSSITNQVGFYVTSLSGAGSNFGFRGAVSSGSNRWNLYMDGTAANYLAGNTGIGGLPGSNVRLALGGTSTGTANQFGIYNSETIASDVTGNYSTFTSAVLTQAAAFTLSNLYHFRAAPQPFGAGSAVTNQTAFYVPNDLTGATNNVGFSGNLPAGSGRYNLYMAGTADNYIAGSIGQGSPPTAAVKFLQSGNFTGATAAAGFYNNGTIQSDVTTNFVTFQSVPSTAAASFTLGEIRHFAANQGTIGAGSTLGAQAGFYAGSNLTGATNNYGFFGAIGAAAGRFNLYMSGTATNYLAGETQIGSLTDLGAYILQVSGETIMLGGLGITRNAGLLPVNPSSAQYVVHIGNTDATGAGVLLDGSGGGPILLLRRAGGTKALPTAVTSGTLVGTIGSGGHGTSGYISSRTTEINALASQTWTDSVWGSRLEFKVTAVGGSSLTTAARLDSDGFNATAIGQTTPAAASVTTLVATTSIGVGAAPTPGVSLHVRTTLTAVAGEADGTIAGVTLTAAANSDLLAQIAVGGSLAKGAFTGLNAYGISIGNPSVSGAGTITNHYQLYISTPTRGTNNYSIYSAGGLNVFGGDTTIGLGGTGSNSVVFGLNSGNTGAAGAYMTFARNSVINTYIGDGAAVGGHPSGSLDIQCGGNVYISANGGVLLSLISGVLYLNGGLVINENKLMATQTSFANGAGVAAGTLTNAPAAGDPTKWIPVDDNGVTRHIPAW